MTARYVVKEGKDRWMSDGRCWVVWDTVDDCETGGHFSIEGRAGAEKTAGWMNDRDVSPPVQAGMARFHAKLAEVDRAELDNIASQCSSECVQWCRHKLARRLLALQTTIEKVPHLYLDGFHVPLIGNHQDGPKSRQNCIKLGGRCMFDEQNR